MILLRQNKVNKVNYYIPKCNFIPVSLVIDYCGIEYDIDLVSDGNICDGFLQVDLEHTCEKITDDSGKINFDIGNYPAYFLNIEDEKINTTIKVI